MSSDDEENKENTITGKTSYNGSGDGNGNGNNPGEYASRSGTKQVELPGVETTESPDTPESPEMSGVEAGGPVVMTDGGQDIGREQDSSQTYDDVVGVSNAGELMVDETLKLEANSEEYNVTVSYATEGGNRAELRVLDLGGIDGERKVTVGDKSDDDMDYSFSDLKREDPGPADAFNGSVEDYVEEFDVYARENGLIPGTSDGDVLEQSLDYRGDGRIGNIEEFDQDEISDERYSGSGATEVNEVVMDGDFSDPEDERGQSFYFRPMHKQELRERELIAYNIAQATGCNQPRHEFYIDEDVPSNSWNVSEEGDGVIVSDIDDDFREDVRENIDMEELNDEISTHWLMGNWDYRADNVTVTREGEVQCIDFDRSGDDMTGDAGFENDITRARSNSRALYQQLTGEKAPTGNIPGEEAYEDRLLSATEEKAKEWVEDGTAKEVISIAAETNERIAKNITRNIYRAATGNLEP